MLILSTNNIVLIEYSNYHCQRGVNFSPVDVQIRQQFLMILSRISMAIFSIKSPVHLSMPACEP
jgi:hypothetical protein